VNQVDAKPNTIYPPGVSRKGAIQILALNYLPIPRRERDVKELAHLTGYDREAIRKLLHSALAKVRACASKEMGIKA